MKNLVYLIIIINLLGCSNNSTETGNPGVTITMSDYSTTSLEKTTLTPFAVSQVQFCFKRLRFKTENESTSPDPSIDDDNIDLNLGLIALSPTGEEITTVNVPPGEYTRIEFDLEKDCDGQVNPSVVVDNDNDGGTPFQTDDRITIKFEGLVSISSDTTLDLAIGNLINALDTVTDANDIKTTLENAGSTGSF